METGLCLVALSASGETLRAPRLPAGRPSQRQLSHGNGIETRNSTQIRIQNAIAPASSCLPQSFHNRRVGAGDAAVSYGLRINREEWSRRPELNWRPPDYKSGALPAELHRHSRTDGIRGQGREAKQMLSSANLAADLSMPARRRPSTSSVYLSAFLVWVRRHAAQ